MLSVGVSTQPYLSAWPQKQNWTKTLMYKTTILPYRLCATTKEFSSFHITAATCLLWISSSQLGWWDIALIKVKCGITLLTWTYGIDQTIRGTMWYWETNSKWMHQYFCLYMVLPGYNLKKSKPKQKKPPQTNKKTHPSIKHDRIWVFSWIHQFCIPCTHLFQPVVSSNHKLCKFSLHSEANTSFWFW